MKSYLYSERSEKVDTMAGRDYHQTKPLSFQLWGNFAEKFNRAKFLFARSF